MSRAQGAGALLRMAAIAVAIAAASPAIGGCSSGDSAPTTAPSATTLGTPLTTIPAGTVTTAPGNPGTSTPLPTAPGPTKTYSDAEYRYRFQYPKDWRFTENVSIEGSAGGSSLKTVGVFDPEGDRKGDILQNGVALSVYKLNTPVDETLMAAFKDELAAVLPDLEGQLTDAVVVEPLRATEVNGIPGFETTYTYSDVDKVLRSRMLFLVNDDLEYQITVQTVDTAWNDAQPYLNVVLDSFSRLP